MIQEFAGRRDYIYARLKALPHTSVVEPKGAFYAFVNVGETFDLEYKGEKVGDVSNLASILLEDYSVAVVPCTDFGFSDHIRLSYAISKEQIKKGIDRIEAFLKELK